MSKIYIEDEDIQGANYSENELTKGDYENCNFVKCSFANTDLSNISFSECEFENCDFSMANISNTSFRDVKFKTCKLLGLHFEDSSKFLLSMYFEGCQLNLSSFYKLNLREIRYIDCSLKEVDFTESNLQGAMFDNCDLAGTIFENTLLGKADFRTSYNFSIDPEINLIKKAKFSKDGALGLLYKYNIDIE